MVKQYKTAHFTILCKTLDFFFQFVLIAETSGKKGINHKGYDKMEFWEQDKQDLLTFYLSVTTTTIFIVEIETDLQNAREC